MRKNFQISMDLDRKYPDRIASALYGLNRFRKWREMKTICFNLRMPRHFRAKKKEKSNFRDLTQNVNEETRRSGCEWSFLLEDLAALAPAHTAREWPTSPAAARYAARVAEVETATSSLLFRDC